LLNPVKDDLPRRPATRASLAQPFHPSTDTMDLNLFLARPRVPVNRRDTR